MLCEKCFLLWHWMLRLLKIYKFGIFLAIFWKKNLFDKKFAKFSWSFQRFFVVLVTSETCWDLFGPTRMHSDTVRYAHKRSEAFGRFRNFLRFFWFLSRFSTFLDVIFTKDIFHSTIFVFSKLKNSRLPSSCF